MKKIALASSLILALALVACGDDDDTSTTTSTSSTTSATGGSGQGGSGGATSASGGAGGSGGDGGMAPFEVSVPNHNEGDTWENIYECPNCMNGGMQTSPELNWTAGPAGTQSYAVVMRDLDFQNGFIHWVMWDIPVDETGLAQGIPEGFMPGAPAPAGSKQAPFNGQLQGYLGMCSCMSINTYEFTVFAMPDTTLAGLDQNSDKETAAAAIEAAALASAAISGES